MIIKYIDDITDTEWQVVTLNNLKYITFKAKSNGKALIRQVKEDKTVGEYIIYKNYKYYINKSKKVGSECYCRRCGHDKRSIYHKVFQVVQGIRERHIIKAHYSIITWHQCRKRL